MIQIISQPKCIRKIYDSAVLAPHSTATDQRGDFHLCLGIFFNFKLYFLNLTKMSIAKTVCDFMIQFLLFSLNRRSKRRRRVTSTFAPSMFLKKKATQRRTRRDRAFPSIAHPILPVFRSPNVIRQLADYFSYFLVFSKSLTG